jgi:hypothetical protein
LKGKSVDDIVDKFWEEEMLFRKMEGPFNPRRFNSEPSLKGLSWVFHERYSLPETEVFGFVGCRVTSKNLGIGACERNWGDVKSFKTGKRALLKSAEKRAILTSTSTALIQEARIRNKDEMATVEQHGGTNEIVGDEDFR